MRIEAWGETFGDAEYSSTFETFVAGSVEKIQTPMALGQVITFLHAHCRSQARKTPLILDVGSHDGATLQTVLRDVTGVDRVRVLGLDYKADAVRAFETRFRADADDAGPLVETAAAAAGDAFSGDIGATFGLDKGAVDYVLVSHVLYGVDAAEVKTLLDDVTGNLLSDRGAAFFIHVSEAGSTLVGLRNRYGGRAERDVPASADKVRCTPTAIAAAVDGERLHSIAYPVRTYFEKMTGAEWDAVETATSFDELSKQPRIARNIARIAFIPLRTPQALVRDNGAWRALTREVRARVQGTESDGRGGYIEDNIVLQVVSGSTGARDVARAVRALADAMPNIQRAAEAALLARLA